ncbi:hypothetical protein L1049_015495 [Liquidambar formosana]|uniref:Uncharacterized protein n=1 Tax=Liquidambar formosana TaxID=63359 RepID=A0AAP0RXN7_LIQFO
MSSSKIHYRQFSATSSIHRRRSLSSLSWNNQRLMASTDGGAWGLPIEHQIQKINGGRALGLLMADRRRQSLGRMHSFGGEIVCNLLCLDEIKILWVHFCPTDTIHLEG